MTKPAHELFAEAYQPVAQEPEIQDRPHFDTLPGGQTGNQGEAVYAFHEVSLDGRTRMVAHEINAKEAAFVHGMRERLPYLSRLAPGQLLSVVHKGTNVAIMNMAPDGSYQPGAEPIHVSARHLHSRAADLLIQYLGDQSHPF